MGTNNILRKVLRNIAQFFKPLKAQDAQFDLFSEVQLNFRNKLFDLIQAQNNSAIAEWDFRTKSIDDITIKIKQN